MHQFCQIENLFKVQSSGLRRSALSAGMRWSSYLSGTKWIWLKAGITFFDFASLILDISEVSVADGEAKAREWGVLFMETSAKEGVSIKPLFSKIAKKLPGATSQTLRPNEESPQKNYHHSTRWHLIQLCSFIHAPPIRGRKTTLLAIADYGI